MRPMSSATPSSPTPRPTPEASTPTPRAAGRVPGLEVNWVAFLATGAALGFLLGVAAHLRGPEAVVGGMAYGFRTSALFLGAFGAMIGAMVGGLVGVLADAVLRRRGR